MRPTLEKIVRRQKVGCALRARDGWFFPRALRYAVRAGSFLGASVATVFLLCAAANAAEAVSGKADAMQGPWLWLEPDLGSVHLTPSLTIGPWRELAVSRDHARREAELKKLSLPLDVVAPAAASESPDAANLIAGADGEPVVRAAILDSAAIQSGRLLEAAGEWKAAAEAYESVIVSNDRVLVETWQGLAVNRARSGDAVGAERAFLQGLDASGPAPAQIRFRFDFAGFLVQQGRLLEAQAVLEALVPHAPDALLLQDALAGLGISIELAALANVQGMPAVWPQADPAQGWDAIDPRVGSAVALLPESTQSALLPWVEKFGQEESRKAVLVVSAIVVTLLTIFVLFRQRGDVAIALGYPEELRGIFRIRIRNGHRASPDASTEKQIQKGGSSTRKEHHMVSRETQFQRLFTGRYHVIVDGLLIDPETEEVLEKIHQEKILRVRHGRTTRLEFDVAPTTCPVDFEIVWGDRPAHEAQITVPGFVDKPRQTTKGKVRVLLPQGSFRLLIGCGDRVFEQPLDVASYRPTSVSLDVLESEPVFKGCPPAVEPFLTNDLARVARALERDGQSELGFRLLAAMHQSDGESSRAADYFESAGDIKEAAELRLAQGEPGRAAALFEQAQEWIEAAEAYRLDGAVLHAGECYERAFDYERAIECYEESGAVDRWLTALERCGLVFAAANLAIKKDQRPRAIRLLQRVEPTDADFAEACGLLADAFETEEHYDLAAGKLEEFIATFRPSHATSDVYSRLADLWEQAGHLERALDVLEDLRRREPTFPNVAARIELLRKQRSASGHLFLANRAPSGRTSDGNATAFVDDVRYELLEEIGRGGMGVVYRARDTRLDRVVALKQLPDGLRRHHPRALHFFVREAQSAARLNHPNIVTVYDADQQDGHFFITMELLEGNPLQSVLRDRGALTPTNILGIARQVCRGLEYAHSQGIIHRDIKTANLFVTTERVVKIMDFGLAKVLEEVRGATTLVSGTPFYMSPEQVIGGDVDHRTDLYSLGVTLFELATGSVPFDSGEVAYHHRHTPVRDPRELRVDLPDGISQLILRLLSKSPDDRFSSAGAVLDAITQIDSES